MKNKKIVLGLFICLAVVQIAVPVWAIVQREIALNYGARFKFRTAPVDPYDAFRGRYVAIYPEESSAPAGGALVKRGDKVYAHIVEGKQGFAEFSEVTFERPAGNAFIRTRVSYVAHDADGAERVYLELPIDRFYMEEKAAPAAEEAYRRYSAAGERDAFVVVRVNKGLAVIEDLYVGGKPIGKLVRELERGQP
jgi:uncharacterized membrane-anchored protein